MKKERSDVVVSLSMKELKLLSQIMDVGNYHIPDPRRTDFDLWDHLFCHETICPFYDECNIGGPCDRLLEKLITGMEK